MFSVSVGLPLGGSLTWCGGTAALARRHRHRDVLGGRIGGRGRRCRRHHRGRGTLCIFAIVGVASFMAANP